MPAAAINNRVTIDGIVYTTTESIPADGTVRKEKLGDNVLPVAKVGALTTRTDDNTGVLTMAASHGITDGLRLDVYWSGGSRRGMTVGTVTVNSVPIDGGAGDVLPADETAITAQVPVEEEFLATGDDVQYIAVKSSRKGIVVFADASDVELHAVATAIDGANGGGYQWFTGSGLTNPLAGDDVAKVFFSNGDSANTNGLIACVGVN